MKNMSNVRGGALALLAMLGACSSSSQKAAEDTGTNAVELYGLGSFGAPWPQGVVPVCFQDPTASPDLQAIVKSTLINGWQKAANISFTGFGVCLGGNEATVVFQPLNGGGITAGIGVGSDMVTLPNDTTPARLAAVTLHEFGHVLGFAHEMGRPDNFVDGGALQCGGFDGDEPGGVYLTAHYDPNSIMNYCADSTGAPALSVGDILGVSSPSGYGTEPACVFQSAATACTATSGQTYEETWTVPFGCPTPWDTWVLQVNDGGSWTNVQHSCSSGVAVGTCGTAVSPTSFTFGTQNLAGALTGPAVGSVQSVRMCGANGNCTGPFDLTISPCNLFYISPGNDPLQVTQGGDATANLLMSGAWVSADDGVNATAQIISNPNSDVGFTFSLGTSSADPGTGQIDFMAHASLTAAVGTYTVAIQGTDPTSGVKITTEFPVEVLPCTTTPVSQVCTNGACGTRSIGCGQSTDCGGCATGDYCSSGICCPNGYSSNGQGGCVSNTPPTCPPTEPYCAALGKCATTFACNRAGGGGGGCTGTSCM